MPLLREDRAPKPISGLNPVFEIRGERRVMVAQAIASVPGHELRRAVASLMEQHGRVIRALDTLLVGF